MKILTAIDGSDCSKAVLESASYMQCEAGTEFMVVSAIDFLEPLPSLEGLKQKEIAATEKLVHNAVQYLREKQPNATVTGAVLDGYACEEILSMCKEWQADVVMVGSHGRSGIDYLLMGSVSRTIFLEAPCAVRIVRKKSEEHKRSLANNVILAMESAEHANALIEHVLDSPWSQGTKIRCIHVVPDAPRSMLSSDSSDFSQTIKEQYDNLIEGRKAWLDVAAMRLNDKLKTKVATAEILRGEPRKVILDLAKNWPADLVILGSHGRRGIDKAIIGSVSEAVAMHAQCSVEMLRIRSLAKKKVHIIV